MKLKITPNPTTISIMNLWAKSLRQLSFVTVALFFFSCEDENAILGFKNPVPKFNVSFVEIPLTSNFHLIDSIITDNKNGAGNMLIGRYQDNVLGKIQAESYLQIYPGAATQIPITAIFDSLTFSIRYSFYGYGFSGESTERFAIHELFDSLARTSAVRYQFNHDDLAYNPTPMAVASVTVKSDSLVKQYNTNPSQQDTLTARARLSDDLGRKIFALLQEYNFTTTATKPAGPEYRAFLEAVRGLALIPTESNAVLGFKIFNGFSGVTVHYRTFENGAVKDTLSRGLGFNLPSFTKIRADREGTVLYGVDPYKSLAGSNTSGARYIQSGNPAITKLDLANFYAFADTVGNVMVNEASLVIDGVESSLTTPAISSLYLKVLNEDNTFTNYGMASDRAAMDPYLLTQTNLKGILLVDGKHYAVKFDQAAEAAALRYSDGSYSTYLTLFIQRLINFRNDADADNDTGLRYLGLYPFSPGISSSVSRTVFNAENVKLRIYYTKPTLTTTPN